MSVIDMQLYPLAAADHEGVGATTPTGLERACAAYAGAFAKLGVSRGLMVILNPDYFRLPGASRALAEARRAHPGRFEFAPMLDFRRRDASDLLAEAAKAGARSLKFHAYRQEITARDHGRILTLCRKAAKLGLYPTVCCSHGTRALGRHSGVELAAFLSGGLKGPVVMAHAGGARLIDAMLVAEDAKNVLLDTSFTLDYYEGSSLEADLAFAIRKLGPARWMFGSDAPFVPQAQSLRRLRAFLRRHRFSDKDASQIQTLTARSLLG